MNEREWKIISQLLISQKKRVKTLFQNIRVLSLTLFSLTLVKNSKFFLTDKLHNFNTQETPCRYVNKLRTHAKIFVEESYI